MRQDELYYDPYDVEIDADPYPTYRRLRDEAPLYHNERVGFWGLSRFDDVEQALKDWKRFSSAKGDILEVVKADPKMPPGVFINEDPPRAHDAPGPRVACFHAEADEPARGAGPGFLRRVPGPARRRGPVRLRARPWRGDAGEGDRDAHGHPRCRSAVGPGRGVSASCGTSQVNRSPSAGTTTSTVGRYAEYVAWREKNPSDDLITELLNVEFEDLSGTGRTVDEEEILTFIAVIAGAGVETTGRLFGWMGKVLAEHPDQRREISRTARSSRTRSRNCCATSRRVRTWPATSPRTSSTTARRFRPGARCCSWSRPATGTSAASTTRTASTSTATSATT